MYRFRPAFRSPPDVYAVLGPPKGTNSPPRKGRRTTPPTVAIPSGPSRAARTLALAHHIERLVAAGELASYAAAAQALGLTRARLTQVMNLLLLAPRVQERLLVGGPGWSGHGLRVVVREACWRRQLDMAGLTAEALAKTLVEY